MLFAFISCFICGLLTKNLNINKLNGIYIPLIYFIARTIYYILKNRKEFFLAIIGMYIVFSIMFGIEYFSQKTPYVLFNYKSVELTEYIDNEFPDTSRKIYFDKNAIMQQQYIYTLLANKISPYEFASKTPITWSPVMAYGRYNFYVNSDYMDKLVQEGSIYVIKKRDYLKLNAQNENYNIDEFEDCYIIYK